MTRDLPARGSQWQAGLITPHAGLALLGEFAVGLGLLDSIDRYLVPERKVMFRQNPNTRLLCIAIVDRVIAFSIALPLRHSP